LIVLDTHTWVWWVSCPDWLSAVARNLIDESEQLAVSPISLWEVATLVRRGRLKLNRDVEIWTRQALARPRLELIPISIDIALQAGGLPESVRGDPADRLIVATALMKRAKLVTKDARLHELQSVTCVW
jgi:PIN domain nuclease of toxin-antitoxin system